MTASPRPALWTRAVRGGLAPDPVTGAIEVPVYQNTTYAQAGVGTDKGFTYSRCANPTVAALERALGELDDAPPAVAFATGLAAVAGLLITLTRSGDHVVCGDVVYGGTTRLLTDILSRYGVEATFVDTAEAENVRRALTPRTRLVLIETPANPTLKLTDIASVSAICRHAGVPLAVDNTFLTAALQDCFALGADIILYSTTKFIEGHNATVGGAVLSRDQALLDEIRLVRKTLGSIQSPQEAALTLRGLKTLPLRIRQHTEHALRIAEWLEADGRALNVRHPDLASFPQRDLARRQQRAGGGVLAFEAPGGLEGAKALVSALKLCYLAESLGATETLVTHPASMTHTSVPPATRSAVGVTDALIRISVGLEDPADIIADLSQALDAAQRAPSARGNCAISAHQLAPRAACAHTSTV
ncbi:MAG: trans-sulfuration enzyme family protein [Phycisphaerales bacterium JB039]